MKKIFFLGIIILLTSGCHSYLELNDLAIINAIGISKKDDNFVLSVSLVTNDETMKPKTVIYEAKGQSINDTLENLSLSLNKKIYLSHLNLLLLNETIRTNDFYNIINFFLNNSNSREDFLVAYASDINKVLENADFNEINDLIKINKRETSKVVNPTMFDIIDSFYNKEVIYLTNLEYSNNTIECNGIEAFFNNKYEFISTDKALFVNYLIDDVESYKYSLECDNNKFLYLNVLNAKVSNGQKLRISNEIKVLNNDCYYDKEKINLVFNEFLKSNLVKFTTKDIKITNTIRGNYESK